MFVMNIKNIRKKQFLGNVLLVSNLNILTLAFKHCPTPKNTSGSRNAFYTFLENMIHITVNRLRMAIVNDQGFKDLGNPIFLSYPFLHLMSCIKLTY